ncbi:MAG: DUF3995 domain-containing protein [Pseudomonadota bacterium]
MQALSIGIAICLLIIMLLHALWGFRVWWPIADELTLARTVVGAPGIKQMPSSAACFAVAFLLFLAVTLNLLLGGVVELQSLPKTLIAVGGLGASSVFILRGIIGYFPFWARLTPELPLRAYDQWAYSPLCILLGVGMLALSWLYCVQEFSS